MPYTPPTPPSPANSNKTSPSITRNSSYEISPQSQAQSDIPRSRSAQYLQKHRRAPSIADDQHKSISQKYDSHNEYGHGNRGIITHEDGNAAVTTTSNIIPISGTQILEAEHLSMSPVEFANGSSEDDDDHGRTKQIAHLVRSLRSGKNMLIIKRQPSPDRALSTDHQHTSLLAANSDLALSPEAKKIAHSRSSSEIVGIPVNHLAVFEQSSLEGSDEDGLEMKRIPMVRKKSGELVRPALRDKSASRRPISAPGTPTFPKAVHFNENIEQVRHFLQVDKPSAVSADSSPVEAYESETDFPFMTEVMDKSRLSEWEISFNAPPDSHDRECMPIRVEQINLSLDGKTLIGVVATANIAFDKWVFARFTFDYWKTTSEVACEWTNVRHASSVEGYDYFTFSIKLSDQANLQNKTLFLCAKYYVGGQEYWDNNQGANYQIDFSRKVLVKKSPPLGKITSQVSVGGIPRSRNSAKGSITRPRSFPMGSSDDEFSTAFESPFRLRGKSLSDRQLASHTFVDQTQHNTASKLSYRYDFNASLHAALMTAQDKLGEKSGLKNKPTVRVVTATTSSANAISPRVSPSMARADCNSDRPILGSAEYQALIKKFCYFGSPMDNNTAATSPQLKPMATHAVPIEQIPIQDSANLSSDTSTTSPSSPSSVSPPSPIAQLSLTDSRLEPKVEKMSEPCSKSRTSSPSLRARSPHLRPFRSPSPGMGSSPAFQNFLLQELAVQSAQC